jgi:hypothetical protein
MIIHHDKIGGDQMKTLTSLKKLALGALATSALLWGTVTQAIPTQIGIAIDGSGSINSTEFATQRNGLASAFAALPTDSSVEITVVQFSSGAVTEISPVVIDSVATRDALVASTNAITQIGGGTVPGTAIDLLTSLMTSSANFGGDSIINLSTDGGFYLPDAKASAEAAKAAGIDALTAEAIGSGADTGNLLQMVYNPSSNPGDGSAVLLATDASPPNPLTSPAWVVPVSNFAAFGPVLDAKIQAIVQPKPVPEPNVLYLLGIGLLAWVFSVRVVRRRRNHDMNLLAAA